MKGDVAFVGDVHGNLIALLGLCDALVSLGQPHTVFLGDYINKGPQSGEVLQELLSQSEGGHATLLMGNHEAALLEALNTGDLTAFLKMGGAMTVRSYIGGDVGPDVLRDFRAAVPREHVELLRRMPASYELDDLIAQHNPPAVSTPKFQISAHLPVGKLPRVENRSAHLDTGCGTPGGRLTALLWPSLNFIQVDAHGAIVTQ